MENKGSMKGSGKRKKISNTSLSIYLVIALGVFTLISLFISILYFTHNELLESELANSKQLVFNKLRGFDVKKVEVRLNRSSKGFK